MEIPLNIYYRSGVALAMNNGKVQSRGGWFYVYQFDPSPQQAEVSSAATCT